MDATSLLWSIERSCTTIHTLWGESANPPRRPESTGRHTPGPKEPNRAVGPRTEAHRALAFWTQVLVEHVPECIQPGDVINLHDTRALARFLRSEAQTIRACLPRDEAMFCASELRAAADALMDVARPRDGQSVHLGTCPTPIPQPDGTTVPCGADIRIAPHWDTSAIAEDGVTAHGAWTFGGDVTCPSCSTTGDLTWWQDCLVGPMQPVTSETLRSELRRRMGITASAMAVRHWSSRGIITPVGRDELGRNLYDLEDVLRAMRRRPVLDARSRG